MMIFRTETVWGEDNEIASQTERDVGWGEFRSARDQALNESDWRFMSDQSPSDEWIAYRVFLRDLPQDNPGDNSNDACDAWVAYDKPEE